MFALHCSLVSLAPVFSPSFSFGSSLSPASSLLAPPLLPKNSFRLGNPCDASSYSDQNRNGSRIRNPSLAYTAREGLDSIAGDGEVEGDVRSPGTAKGSGTTARGRRLLKVREEKRRREYDRLHNYPTWAKILENACRDDAELRAVLGDSIGNPELMRKRVEERIRKKGGDFRKSKTGSVLAFKVNFRDFNPLDSFIWFELYGAPSDRDVDLLGSVIQSWYVMGRLGAFNSSNLQLANSSMDYNPLYDSDKAAQAMPSSFHDIGDVEFQDNWGRVWVDLGTADFLAVDVLLNCLTVLSSETIYDKVCGNLPILNKLLESIVGMKHGILYDHGDTH
ncbi:uncharacterized protein LOC122012354 isoform X1 [Zingiber officinale]|uniref:uncharacterized protein LOC122012354 isoform X1 n=1 Tax=Zingiber officinale TaxID=94328 RepID=UPI001C4D19B6|nr:uncharacterized protein LOC122012354 isoform X1 [Zingiber officinale]